jgi:hypothetical protein
MEGSCSTGQSPQWAVVPVEEEEEEENYLLRHVCVSILKSVRMEQRASSGRILIKFDI